MFEDRVAKGAALLDKVRPGWEKEVAADRLAMEECDRCILGQLYGGYFAGLKEVLRPPSARQLFAASEHGFTLANIEQDRQVGDVRFARLADAWRAEIRRRLERG